MSAEKQVLVVDDDAATVAIFEKLLAADGWQVESSTSCHEALDRIRNGHHSLVVSDLNMPEMNGIELYEAAIQAKPQLRHRFLFVSGYADSDAVKSFLLEAGCPVLRKPIQLEAFRAVTAQMASGATLAAPPLPAPWFAPHGINLYSGEISGTHSLLSLFNRIQTARLTGALHLLLGRVETRLYFNLGNLVFATSNRPDDGLGELMLREGALTPAQFEAATARMEQGVRFGEALVDIGICTMVELENWLRRQITQVATAGLRCATGRYYFFDAFEEHITPEVGIAEPLGKLVLETVRAARDLPLEALVRDETLFVDLSLDPMVRFQDVSLSEDERRLLSAVSQPMSGQALLRASNLPAMQAGRALYALLSLGMLVSVPPEAAPVNDQPAPPPPTSVQPRDERIIEPPVAESADLAGESSGDFEDQIKEMLERRERGNYYQLLGITAQTPASDVKRCFHRLARRFHPDRHMGRSEWIDSLKNIMEALTVAYKTLVDNRLRQDYDRQLAEGGAFQLGHGKTEKQMTAESCLEKAKECLRAQNFAGSIVWLRKCVELAPNESKYRAMLARSLGAVPQYRQEAIEHFEAAIRLDPWNLSACFQFAELYEAMNLPWRAKPLYEKILDVDSAHSKARERLRRLETTETEKKKKDSGLLGRFFGR